MKRADRRLRLTCPVCGTDTKMWERHHVVWKQNGGTDEPENLLDICMSCHKMAHSGDLADRTVIGTICDAVQLMTHGVAFWEKSGLRVETPPLDPVLLDAYVRRLGYYKLEIWKAKLALPNEEYAQFEYELRVDPESVLLDLLDLANAHVVVEMALGAAA